MAAFDVDYDEVMGNPATSDCPLNFARDENFFIATENALPWELPADGDASRATIAIVWIEALLRKAPVPDPSKLGTTMLLSSCLHLDYVRGALECLADLGLLAAEDGDDESVRDFIGLDDLQRAADQLIMENPQEARLQVDDVSWDDFEDVNAGDAWEWLEDISLEKLTSSENNLHVYSELSLALGPHALDAERGTNTSQFHVMAGAAGGGRLLHVLQAYYGEELGGGAAIVPQFLAHKIDSFWIETRWPYPLDIQMDKQIDHAYDLLPRSKWQKADRSAWRQLARPKIVGAVRLMSPLYDVMHDVQSNPTALTREIQTLGDAILTGDTSQKLVFWRLEQINAHLLEHYSGLIEQEARAGKSTVSIVLKLVSLLQMAGEEKSKEVNEPYAGGVDGADTMAAPKRGQLRRALAEASYAELELTFLPILQEAGQPRKDVQDLLSASFAAKSVLPKAVLLATPGTRQVVYTQLSDFLDLLKDERGSMRLYLGQCVAFDVDEDQVPDTLKTFELDEVQYSLLRSFAWESLDLLNGIILPLRAEEVGTTFKVHNVAQLYHHGEMIDLVGGTVGKLFHGLGYPMTVNKDEGLTFEDFLKKIKRMYNSTLGMTPQQAGAIFSMIDSYVQEALKAAAANAKRIIFGANPADRHLRAWLVASEVVLQKIEESLKELAGVKAMRKRLPGLFTDQQEARSLPGLELTERDTGRGKGRGAGKGKPTGGTSGAGPSNVTRGSQEGAQEGPTDTRTKFAEMSKEMRVKLNPKRVFYYDDDSHSMKSHLFHWKRICEKYGWDHESSCGPVAMTLATDPKNREGDCMDPTHK
ncbi:MAG: hypothetical protein SGPRY_014734 [Prymnesium sp.]